MRYNNTGATWHAKGRRLPGAVLRLAALLAIGLVSGGTLADGDIYKIQGSNGRVEYTDQPPKAGTGVTRLPPAPDTAGVVLVPPKVAEETENRVRARLAEQNRQYDAVTAAEEKLRAAQKAKADGEEPMPGERQRLSGHGSRLNDGYSQRQDQLDNDVKAAQAEVEAARAR
jgi:hypothetical protein